jgi:hypothetical protein
MAEFVTPELNSSYESGRIFLLLLIDEINADA